MPYYLRHAIYIAEYDPQWPDLYAQERHRLQAALGPILLAIEHFGSTAVPGLAAKPIIDILAGVSHLDDVLPCVPALQRLGYHDAGLTPCSSVVCFARGHITRAATMLVLSFIEATRGSPPCGLETIYALIPMCARNMDKSNSN